MSSFINRKKDEIAAVFSKAGIDVDEVIAAVWSSVKKKHKIK